FAIALVALVALFVFAVSVQPDTFHVERSTEIDAPAAVVYAQVSDFNAWEKWNPWLKMDPTTKNENQGQPGEVGHSNRWDGEKTGKGSMVITAVTPAERVDFDLKFVEPYESEATVAFQLDRAGSGTKLTWTMDGKNDFMGKVMALAMDLDEVIGPDYERGLADIKTLAEARAKEEAAEAHAAESPQAKAEPEAADAE
ncbi:MAG: SRPBCC family protein, partial [Myxococcota bacterium]